MLSAMGIIDGILEVKKHGTKNHILCPRLSSFSYRILLFTIFQMSKPAVFPKVMDFIKEFLDYCCED